MQKEKQTIESQLAELRQFAEQERWSPDEKHIYIDDGYSGFYLDRPGLDCLRDSARDGLIDLLLVQNPDRLSRRYAYQVLLLEEFERWGTKVRFLKQPPPESPEQQLLVQVQGATSQSTNVLESWSARAEGGCTGSNKVARFLPRFLLDIVICHVNVKSRPKSKWMKRLRRW